MGRYRRRPPSFSLPDSHPLLFCLFLCSLSHPTSSSISSFSPLQIPFMFLGRSLQGSVSLLNDNSTDQASFEQQQQQQHQMASQPPPPPLTSTSTTTSPTPAPAQSSPPPSASAAASAQHISNVPRTGAAVEKKRNHICQTCSKAFTTSGHLARHIRVHTGERNHKCPFPGCETRCSRQDNLQQQCVYCFSYLFAQLPSLFCFFDSMINVYLSLRESLLFNPSLP